MGSETPIAGNEKSKNDDESDSMSEDESEEDSDLEDSYISEFEKERRLTHKFDQQVRKNLRDEIAGVLTSDERKIQDSITDDSRNDDSRNEVLRNDDLRVSDLTESSEVDMLSDGPPVIDDKSVTGTKESKEGSEDDRQEESPFNTETDKSRNAPITINLEDSQKPSINPNQNKSFEDPILKKDSAADPSLPLSSDAAVQEDLLFREEMTSTNSKKLKKQKKKKWMVDQFKLNDLESLRISSKNLNDILEHPRCKYYLCGTYAHVLKSALWFKDRKNSFLQRVRCLHSTSNIKSDKIIIRIIDFEKDFNKMPNESKLAPPILNISPSLSPISMTSSTLFDSSPTSQNSSQVLRVDCMGAPLKVEGWGEEPSSQMTRRGGEGGKSGEGAASGSTFYIRTSDIVQEPFDLIEFQEFSQTIASKSLDYIKTLIEDIPNQIRRLRSFTFTDADVDLILQNKRQIKEQKYISSMKNKIEHDERSSTKLRESLLGRKSEPQQALLISDPRPSKHSGFRSSTQPSSSIMVSPCQSKKMKNVSIRAHVSTLNPKELFARKSELDVQLEQFTFDLKDTTLSVTKRKQKSLLLSQCERNLHMIQQRIWDLRLDQKQSETSDRKRAIPEKVKIDDSRNSKFQQLRVPGLQSRPSDADSSSNSLYSRRTCRPILMWATGVKEDESSNQDKLKNRTSIPVSPIAPNKSADLVHPKSTSLIQSLGSKRESFLMSDKHSQSEEDLPNFFIRSLYRMDRQPRTNSESADAESSDAIIDEDLQSLMMLLTSKNDDRNNNSTYSCLTEKHKKLFNQLRHDSSIILKDLITEYAVCIDVSFMKFLISKIKDIQSTESKKSDLAPQPRFKSYLESSMDGAVDIGSKDGNNIISFQQFLKKNPVDARDCIKVAA